MDINLAIVVFKRIHRLVKDTESAVSREGSQTFGRKQRQLFLPVVESVDCWYGNEKVSRVLLYSENFASLSAYICHCL